MGKRTGLGHDPVLHGEPGGREGRSRGEKGYESEDELHGLKGRQRSSGGALDLGLGMNAWRVDGRAIGARPGHRAVEGRADGGKKHLELSADEKIEPDSEDKERTPKKEGPLRIGV